MHYVSLGKGNCVSNGNYFHLSVTIIIPWRPCHYQLTNLLAFQWHVQTLVDDLVHVLYVGNLRLYMYMQKFNLGNVENNISLLVQFVKVTVVYDINYSNLDARFILELLLFCMVSIVRRAKGC